MSGAAAGAKKRILVTSGAWQAALACVQSLGGAGHDVLLFDADPAAPLGRSRRCRGVVRSPSEYDWHAYREALLETLEREEIDLLIPISDAAVDVVAAYQDEVRARTRVVIAQHRAVALSRDKAATCRFAEKHGILTPETFYPSSLADVRSLSREIDYPCIAKMRRGTSSRGVRLCATVEELLAFFGPLDGSEKLPIVQRYVPGDIYDATAICDRGRVVALFTFYSPLIYQVGGTPPYAFTLQMPELAETTRKVVAALGWSGAVDLDFIRGPDGRLYFLEINPRLSGTVNLALKLGIDLPRAYFDVAFGEPRDSYQQPYESGLLFRSVLPMELLWLAEDVRGRIGTVLGKSFAGRTLTNIYWSDWPLVAAELRQAWRRIRSRRAARGRSGPTADEAARQQERLISPARAPRRRGEAQ